MPRNYIGRYFDKYRRFFSYDCQDYTFDVDLQNGELYFSRKLISFSGKYSSTKDVDAYFDYPDPNYAFIFDNFWLWW